MPEFLEDVRVTEDGYLWMESCPKQRECPLLLPTPGKLWGLLHPHESGFNSHPQFCQVAVEDLARASGLGEAVRQSISEILHMKDKKADKSMRLTVNRLEKQQTARLNPTVEREDKAYAEATLRTVRTLNSIRAVFPSILNMIHHQQRNDKDLEIDTRGENGKTISVTTIQLATKKKHKKKAKGQDFCWLLGEQVYDVVRKTLVKSAERDIQQVLECLVPDVSVWMSAPNDAPWNSLLGQYVQNQRSRRHTPFPSSLLVGSQVESIATACDKTYLDIFSHENVEAQNIRVLYHQAVDKLVANLQHILQKRYRGAEVRVYGSCLSNLSLGKSSDVDISLHLPAAASLKHDFDSGAIDAKKYDKDMKSCVYRVNNMLANRKDRGLEVHECVVRARVPVIKGSFVHAGNPFAADGSLDFDICFSNEIAVVNSALLSEYTLVDKRVKTFLLCIKAWARRNEVSSAAQNGISSYGWVNLGIFYLQCIGFIPNLQCPKLMEQHDFHLDPDNWTHHANDLETGYLPWTMVKDQGHWKQPEELESTPVTLLLYGFFQFYAKQFPRNLYAASIRIGSISLPRSVFEKLTMTNICIEDPFETYCSHTPHDLGRPCDDHGNHVVFELIENAENYLKNVLEGTDHCASDDFWLLSQVAKTPPPSEIGVEDTPPRNGVHEGNGGKQEGKPKSPPRHQKNQPARKNGQHPGKSQLRQGHKPHPQKHDQRRGKAQNPTHLDEGHNGNKKDDTGGSSLQRHLKKGPRSPQRRGQARGARDVNKDAAATKCSSTKRHPKKGPHSPQRRGPARARANKSGDVDHRRPESPLGMHQSHASSSQGGESPKQQQKKKHSQPRRRQPPRRVNDNASYGLNASNGHSGVQPESPAPAVEAV